MNPRHLFGISILVAALLIVGAIFALAVSAEAVLPASTAQETLRIAPNSSGMSEDEFMVYAGRMEQRYGPEAVSALRLHIPYETRGSSPEPAMTPNIRYVSAWNGSLEVRNDDGVVLASSDNALVLYALDLTDEEGREHYYWWQWGAARNREDTRMGDASNLRNFWSRVAFENSSSNLLIYAPDSDIYGTEDTVTLRFGLEFPGPDCHSISRDFVLHQGKIRPKPGECRVGSAGRYAVDWVGNHEGTQSIYGICEERREDSTGSAVLWTYCLTTRQF
ncbi:hypothetical protein [Methanoculleus bourgensis]|uniref:hypothetical protein n=1 Tax=Methanoculleus bourgensis TaxID=83986 RepID=UPI0022EF63BC|nr:hypothetical protein [Methanoculleus bourgensis]GLI45823.1 hypothetical protein MBOURGENBZM_06150 [Methanoculleus bourgensis]